MVVAVIDLCVLVVWVVAWLLVVLYDDFEQLSKLLLLQRFKTPVSEKK